MKKSVYDGYRYRCVVGEKTEWKGYFITSRRFYHLPYVSRYGHLRDPENNSEERNVHTFFRKNFSVKDKPVASAKAFITGDDLYKLYLNGSFVGEGPAQSYPADYRYNCFDVKDLIKSGENAVGVHVYYQGLFNIYLVSADNLCGMIAQIEITYSDGEKEIFASGNRKTRQRQ